MLDVAMKEVDRDFWTSYLDDILTFSRKPWAHTQLATGIKIQPCNTKLFQSEVEHLEHKISKGGVSMIPDIKIKAWPLPKSGKEVAMFLGFARYYCTFIPQYSALTNRLNRIKKAEKFLWIKEIE